MYIFFCTRALTPLLVIFFIAFIEQRKQAELKAMVQNAAMASEHRSKNKIVERIYSDVKGLKSVLRKSRRGTK